MKKIILSAVVLALGAGPVWAEGAKDVALPFIRIDRNPATAALAGAGTASPSAAAWSAFRNAAVLPFGDGRMDAAASWQSWAPDGASSNNINAGAAFRFGGKYGMSVGLSGDQYQAVEGTHPVNRQIAAGFGIRFTDRLGMGINLRYASYRFEKDYHGFCGDLSFLYAAAPGWTLSVGVSSIGPQVDYGGTRFALPGSVTLAADYTRELGPGTIQADLDLDGYFTGDFGVALGAAYGYRDFLFVRAGYRLASESAVLPSCLGLGLGLKLRSVSLDVAYLAANPVVGGTFMAGFGLHF